jgi:hypothetical protein
MVFHERKLIQFRTKRNYLSITQCDAGGWRIPRSRHQWSQGLFIMQITIVGLFQRLSDSSLQGDRFTLNVVNKLSNPDLLRSTSIVSPFNI